MKGYQVLLALVLLLILTSMASPVLAAEPKVEFELKQSTIGDHSKDDDELSFVITKIGSGAPQSIAVRLSDGSTATVELTKVTGGTAHYNVDLTQPDNSVFVVNSVTGATANLPVSWQGQFNISHGPCYPQPSKTPTKEPTRETPTVLPTTATPSETPTSTLTPVSETPTAVNTTTATGEPTTTNTPVTQVPSETSTLTPSETATQTDIPTSSTTAPEPTNTLTPIAPTVPGTVVAAPTTLPGGGPSCREMSNWSDARLHQEQNWRRWENLNCAKILAANDAKKIKTGAGDNSWMIVLFVGVAALVSPLVVRKRVCKVAVKK